MARVSSLSTVNCMGADDDSIGDRLASLRRRRGLTQEDLAEVSGVAVSTVRKLEQGARYTARVATLNALAHGLRVPLSVLLSTHQVTDTVRDGEPIALAPIRRVLTPGQETAPAGNGSTVAELRGSVDLAWKLYQRGDYETLAALVPELITECAAATRENGPPAQAVLADAYHVTASLLMALSSEDLAYIAVDRLLAAAERTADPLAQATGQDTLAWIFSRHGRYDDAAHTAITAAEAIEPSFTRASPNEISTWAGLILRAVMVTSRNEQADITANLLNVAEAAAHRVGHRNDRWSVISPTNVAMHQARAAVELGNPARGLDLAREVPGSRGMPQVWRARHLIDVAQAHTLLRNDRDAVGTLETIERTAPGWLRYQGLARSMVAELLRRERRSATPSLRSFAAMLGVRE